MNIHVTNIHQIGGTASFAQEGVMQVARQLGFQEMGILRRSFYKDYWNTMWHHLDGIIAPLYYGDIVIFQYPSWNGTDFDREFVKRIKMYRDTKLILFVQDIQQLMFDSGEEVLRVEIEILNYADLLILPSPKLYDYLVKNGLKNSVSVIYQKIWEMPEYPKFTEHRNQKKLLFTGNYTRFPFLKDYHGKTVLEQYDRNVPERENDASFQYKGFYEPHQLMSELSKGGYGLVWCDEEYLDRYYAWNQPHKLGFDLAAGIPVVIRKGSTHEAFVREHRLGYVVESLEEADELVQNTSDEVYQEMVSNIAGFQTLSLKGTYTKRLLLDAVIQVMEK